MTMIYKYIMGRKKKIEKKIKIFCELGNFPPTLQGLLK